jgi:RHS repeat-associated protein
VANDDGATTEMLVSARGWVPVVLWQTRHAEHYVSDHAGKPHEVVREGRGVVWRANYEPFGRALVTCEAPSAAYDLRMPGQIEDQESGLFYNWNRYYDPTQARYVTPDPAGIDAGLNLYDYPRDPVNWSDPMGLSCPNPQLVEENAQWGWQIHRHDDGSLTITADCRRGFTTPKPGGLRPTIHSGEDNRENFPEAHLGQDGRLIVMEGTHRSVAASRGQQMPQDPDNPHLGGVPGRPGYMTYAYSPEYNDDQPGVPLSSLDYPPGYPHQL